MINSNVLPKTVMKIKKVDRGLSFGIIIVIALVAFESFNYSTTDYALSDLLGNLRFLGLRWATILAIAFCGIDFAGIARLFAPEGSTREHREVWYLFGAWFLAATMNAMLTWWGVSLAIINQQSAGVSVLKQETILRAVPIFVAVLVWTIRVLIIGTFSVAGEQLFRLGEQPITRTSANYRRTNPVSHQRIPANSSARLQQIPSPSFSSPRRSTLNNRTTYETENNPLPEPTYVSYEAAFAGQAKSSIRHPKVSENRNSIPTSNPRIHRF